MIGEVLTYDEAMEIENTRFYMENGVQKMRDDLIKPQEGFQESVLSSPASFVICGGSRGSGKSIALLMAPLYDYWNPRFSGRIFRREKDDFQRGLWQDSELFYSEIGIATTTDFRWQFHSGGALKFEQISNEDKADQRFRGGGIPYIGFDEINQFSEETIWIAKKANRNAYGIHSRIIGTTNPDVESWVFKMIGWYLDDNGVVIPERDGKIRYFYKYGKTIDEIYWGNTREEVYRKAKHYIDKFRKSELEDVSSKYDMIQSFQFISGNVWQNKILTSNDKNYIGNVQLDGGEIAERELLGIWRKVNIDEELIKADMMQNMFDNSPQIDKGQRWITIDVATEGGDFFIAFVWNDWHIIDVVVVNNIAANDVIVEVKKIAQRYHIPYNNIMYDADGIGGFLGSKYANRGFLPNAIGFHGGGRPKQPHVFANINAEAVNEMQKMLEDRKISIEPSVLNKTITKLLPDGKLAYQKTIGEILMTERKAYRWIMEGGSIRGKCQLIKKKDMRKILGGGSPDFIEAIKIKCYQNYIRRPGTRSIRGLY